MVIYNNENDPGKVTSQELKFATSKKFEEGFPMRKKALQKTDLQEKALDQ